MKPKDPDWVLDEVRKYVSYNADTGFFTRVGFPSGMGSKCLLGKPAGHRHPRSGYIWIRVMLRSVTAGRLAWFMTYGKWPRGCVDHIDGDRSNNRISNLREATRQENNRNARVRKDSKTGVRGVSIDKQCPISPYKVMVGSKHVGHFRSIEEARAAREREAVVAFKEFAVAPDRAVAPTQRQTFEGRNS